jgi:hypothetical protein
MNIQQADGSQGLRGHGSDQQSLVQRAWVEASIVDS